MMWRSTLYLVSPVGNGWAQYRVRTSLHGMPGGAFAHLDIRCTKPWKTNSSKDERCGNHWERWGNPVEFLWVFVRQLVCRAMQEDVKTPTVFWNFSKPKTSTELWKTRNPLDCEFKSHVEGFFYCTHKQRSNRWNKMNGWNKRWNNKSKDLGTPRSWNNGNLSGFQSWRATHVPESLGCTRPYRSGCPWRGTYQLILIQLIEIPTNQLISWTLNGFFSNIFAYYSKKHYTRIKHK